MWSKFDMIIDYIDNILVNKNPLKSIIMDYNGFKFFQNNRL